MAKTTYACIRRMTRQQIEAAGIVYVGRRSSMRGLPGHPLGNPFKVDRDGTKAEVIAKFRAHLLARPDLIAIAKSLRGKTLGCWCQVDEPCHAKVIGEIADSDSIEQPAAAGRGR